MKTIIPWNRHTVFLLIQEPNAFWIDRFFCPIAGFNVKMKTHYAKLNFDIFKFLKKYLTSFYYFFSPNKAVLRGQSQAEVPNPTFRLQPLKVACPMAEQLLQPPFHNLHPMAAMLSHWENWRWPHQTPMASEVIIRPVETWRSPPLQMLTLAN